VRSRTRRRVFLLKTLLPSPSFDQRPIYGEVLITEQILLSGQLQHLLEKGLRHVALQQPIAVFRKYRRIPYRIVHVQIHKPTEQEVVVQLLQQESLAAHRVEHLQQQRPQQFLRRYRGPARARVQGLEGPRTVATSSSTLHPPSAESAAADDSPA